MSTTLLLLAPEHHAESVAQALRSRLDLAVEPATQRRDALTLLRKQEYLLVLVDEGLAIDDPTAADLLYRSAGSAPVLEINFALSSAERIVRQVRSAIARRSIDRAQARTAAALDLQNELSSTLTGLLLETQLALRQATTEQEPRLRHLVELAGELRERLRA